MGAQDEVGDMAIHKFILHLISLGGIEVLGNPMAVDIIPNGALMPKESE